jgi:hypothetical protein
MLLWPSNADDCKYRFPTGGTGQKSQPESHCHESQFYDRCSNAQNAHPFFRRTRRAACIQPIRDSRGGNVWFSYVPEGIATSIVAKLRSDAEGSERHRAEQSAAAKQRLAALKTRMDRIYEDKLDGKIDEELWSRKMTEYRDQEHVLEAALASLNKPIADNHALTVERIFDLGNKTLSWARDLGRPSSSSKVPFLSNSALCASSRNI